MGDVIWLTGAETEFSSKNSVSRGICVASNYYRLDFPALRTLSYKHCTPLERSVIPHQTNSSLTTLPLLTTRIGRPARE